MKIAPGQIDVLVRVLSDKGYTTIAPTVREGAIVYDEVHAASDLPVGFGDEQSSSSYRLSQSESREMFGFAVGPQSFKKFLFPPRWKILSAIRNDGSIEFDSGSTPSGESAEKFAFIGIRPCELQALRIQDKVFLGGAYQDIQYKQRREKIFVVAVQCGKPASTCFCASLNSGPRAESGFDLALTEVIDGDGHYFVVEIGSDSGRSVMESLDCREASEAEVEKAHRVTDTAARAMKRNVDTEGLKELLYANADHPEWEAVAKRCLTCANCTMVCPTCFCTTVEDTTDLAGVNAERWRVWDSCFTAEFSYIHGGSIRATPRARYRQWLTHKFASWVDQFGTFGCVGCGRCITWCPAGIDPTEELRILRGTAQAVSTKE